MAQLIVGAAIAFIAGIIAFASEKNVRGPNFQRSLSTIYGTMIPCAAGITGIMTLYAFEGYIGNKLFLGGIALFV